MSCELRVPSVRGLGSGGWAADSRHVAGWGNDKIVSRDGAFDIVGCGPGVDTVRADRLDLVGVDCEQVRRS